MESLRGKTARWTFGDGPVAGMLFEHALNEDDTIVSRALGGPWKGQSSQEPRYAAMKISDDVHAVSYLTMSGHALTPCRTSRPAVPSGLRRAITIGTP